MKTLVWIENLGRKAVWELRLKKRRMVIFQLAIKEAKRQNYMIGINVETMTKESIAVSQEIEIINFIELQEKKNGKPKQ